MIHRWLAIVIVLVLVSGTVLSLPGFWGRPVTGEKAAQHAQHWLDCVFTAASALTGTGMSPHDVGEDFNLAGQGLILGLMQAGGLGVLMAGTAVGWGLRRRLGWGAGDETTASAGPWRVIGFAGLAMVVFEAAGAAAIYASAPTGEDAPARPVFAAVFHAVSAFCGNGLTLTRDSLMAQGGRWGVYGIFLPLMVVGSIGGPALYEVWRRLVSRSARAGRWSRDARVTLVGTAVLVVGGAAVIFFTESTERWQLRNPRPDTPGRLMVAEPAEDETIVFSGESASAAQQRMRTMAPGQRLAAAAFHGVSARAGGFRVARLDEKSLSPAGRAVLMGLMLVGGGLGGTAGGLSITVVVLLLGAMRVGKNAGGTQGNDVPEGGRDARPPGVGDACPPVALDAGWLLVRGAAGAAVGLGLLIGVTALVLIYREPASVELCWFTAVSACTNSGLAIGPTRLLSPEAQVMVVLAMILGRVIPLAMLGKYLRSCTPAQVEHA